MHYQDNKLGEHFINYKTLYSPGWCGSVGWSIDPYLNGCGLNSWSGQILKGWVHSLVGACMGSNQLMLLSLKSMFLSLPSSLSR